jgi:hypothetical protein
VLLGLGGLVLGAIGFAAGWIAHRPPPGPTCPECPRPERCKPCVAPLPVPTSQPAARTPDAAPPRALDAGAPAPDTRRPAAKKIAGKAHRAPAAKAGMGFLTVTTSAPARVFIDGSSTGLPAPVQRLPLAPGAHRVRVYSEQHQTFSETQWVTIEAGVNASLSFTLGD